MDILSASQTKKEGESLLSYEQYIKNILEEVSKLNEVKLYFLFLSKSLKLHIFTKMSTLSSTSTKF